jgi:hypothetical protein
MIEKNEEKICMEKIFFIQKRKLWRQRLGGKNGGGVAEKEKHF